MVDSCHPLGHTHVIRIFSFKEELEERTSEYAINAANAPIGPQFRQTRVSILDELKPCSLIRSNGAWTRTPVHSLDEIVIKIRRPNSDLSLFQAKHSIVMPGRLAKRHKRDWMAIPSCIVGFFRRINLFAQRL